MRISTAQMNAVGTNGMGRLQNDLYNLQNQLSTGRRIVTPSDDPIGAAQALRVSAAKGIVEMHQANQVTATNRLTEVEGALGSVEDQLTGIYEKAIAAGNATYTASDRAAIATELQQSLGNLVALANIKDSTGNYMFAGYKGTAEPFTVTGATAPVSHTNPSVSYAGDDGQQRVAIGAGQTIQINMPGSEAFVQVKDITGASTGGSMFDAVQNMIDAVQTGASGAAYNTALANLQGAMDTVSNARTHVGTRMAAVESMATMSDAMRTQYAAQISQIEDLDYAQAISTFTSKQTQLTALQQTFAQTSKMSLFDYIA